LEGLLIGIGATSLAISAGFGLYKAYQYYTEANTYYKLSYFNLRGLAETSRMMFAIAGVEYEDHRFRDIPQGDGQSPLRPEFASVKEHLPFGQVPTLQIGGKGNSDDGIILSQSKAIERFLARKFGLLGSNPIEAQLIDSVCESIRDARDAYFKVNKDAEEKPKYFTTTLVNFFKYWNRFALTHSGAPREFPSSTPNTFVGSKLSLADIVFFHFLSIFDDQTAVSNALASFPALRGIREKVATHPAIKKWIATRPVTAF